MKAAFLLSLTFALLWAGGHNAPPAQERLLSRAGEARVAIFQDDLDQARRRAVQQAQRNVIDDLLKELVAAEWYELYASDLAKRVLNRLDRYIGAYRVRRLETSLDRTQYFAALDAQVDRMRLVADLRGMSLPILGDPTTPLHVLYSPTDPVLGRPKLRGPVLKALTARLELLSVAVQSTSPVPEQAAALLNAPYAGQAGRQSWLASLETEARAVAYVGFRRAEPDPAQESAAAQAGWEARLSIYLVRDGSLLADLAQQPGGGDSAGAPAREAAAGHPLADPAVARLVVPLLNQLQPGSIGDPAHWGAQVSRLELRVLGLTSIYDEESFERDFFAEGTPFTDFVLARLTNDAVTYEGDYRGDRTRLAGELEGTAVGAFHIRRVFWFNDTLELVVERIPGEGPRELDPFPPEVRPPVVAELLEDLAELRPELAIWQPAFTETEDNGRFDRANSIAFGTPIYGYVDSRGDSDVFVGEALEPGEIIEIEWYRLGRTNLSPVLRLYDEGGILRKTLFLRSEIRHRYTLPAGEHSFYLEAADRFGYLDLDAGGYLNFHYLMWIHREGATPRGDTVRSQR